MLFLQDICIVKGIMPEFLARLKSLSTELRIPTDRFFKLCELNTN